VAGDGWRGVLLLHTPSGTVIGLQQHDGNQGEPFDPRRTGLDHLAFSTDNRESLRQWQDHFESLGVDYTPIVDDRFGSVLTFRDPDGRQLEMFCRPDQP
jgi:glyoxylase I family protein